MTRAALDRLGLTVETFPIETGFADIRANMTRMGALLGREARAAELVAAMDAALAAPPSDGPAAARRRCSTPTPTPRAPARSPTRS